MEQKFGGVGLSNMVCIAIFTMLFIIFSKALLTKYEVKWISSLVQAI